MALKDCIRKMEKAGAPLSPEQVSALDGFLELGMTDEQAVRAVSLQSHQNVVDIAHRARNEGAVLAPVSDPVTRLAQFQVRALEKMAKRTDEITAELEQINDDYMDARSVRNFFRRLAPTDERTQVVNDIADDQVLMDLMMQYMLDRGEAVDLLGLKGEDQFELFESFRALEAGMSEAEKRMAELKDERDAIDSRVRVIFHGKDQTFYQDEGPPRLMVRHNLSAEKLGIADGLGGLAVPSMAVTKEGASMTGFGEITLIGTFDLADPAKLPIFDADGYTVRFPQPVYKPAKAAARTELWYGLLPYALRWENQSNLDYQIDQGLGATSNPQVLIWHMLESNAAKAKFLEEVYGEDLAPTKEDVKPRFEWGWDPELIAFFTQQNVSALNYNWEDPRRKNMLKRAAKVVERVAKRSLAERLKLPMDHDRVEAGWRLAGMINTDGTLSEHRFTELQRDAERKGTTQIEWLSTLDTLNSRLDKDNRRQEFQQWIEDQILPLVGEPRLMVNGRLVEYNLENIVRKMKGKLRGTEFMGDQMTEGLMRALVSHRFTTLEKMRVRAEVAMDDRTEVDILRAVAQEQMNIWLGQMAQFYVHQNANGYVDSFEAGDDARRAIIRWATSKGVSSAEDLRTELERKGFEGLPDWLVDEGMEAAMTWLAVPVPYFEGKPQRAVKFEEFAGAVIPTNAPPEVRATLAKRGIPYKEYQVGENIDEGQTRTDAVTEFTQILNDQGERTLFQSEIGFTSGLLTAAQTMPQEKGGAQQMLATLKKQPNVKKQELELLGVEEWALGKGKFTRDELIQFIEAGGIQILETQYGGPTIVDPQMGWELNQNATEDYRMSEFGDEGNMQIFDVFDRSDAFSHHYDLYWDFEAGQVSVTPDGGKTWLEVYGETNNQRIDDGVAAVSRDIMRKKREESGFAQRAEWEGQYQLEGGTNYREVMLHLPEVGGYIFTMEDLKEESHPNLLSEISQEREAAERDSELYWYIDAFSPLPDVALARPEETTRRRVQTFQIPKDPFNTIEKAKQYIIDNKPQPAAAGANYQSHTFSEVKNILAWMRIKDRVGPNGERVLFVEEVQSDWHSAGREFGYRVAVDRIHAEDTRSTANARKKDAYENALDAFNALANAGVEGGNLRSPTAMRNARSVIETVVIENPDWFKKYQQESPHIGLKDLLGDDGIVAINHWRLRALEAQQAQRDVDSLSSGIPDAPFKGNAWAELAMKRIIRLAAEGGYDQVAWTTGEQQADRYDLGQVVNRIEYGEDIGGADPTIYRTVDFFYIDGSNDSAFVDRSGMVVALSAGARGDWIDKPLSAVVGQKITREIMGYEDVDASPTGAISGDGLRVGGGEGMGNFYDNVLVNVTNRAVRKLDKKAGVDAFGGNIADEFKNAWRIQELPSNNAIQPEWVGYYDTEEQADSAMQTAKAQGRKFKKLRPGAHDGPVIHKLDITPDIKALALEGQTLFQDKNRASITFDNTNKAIIRMSQSKDLSSFLHETAHLYLEMMGDLAEAPDASEGIINDYQKMLEYLGVNSRREIGREHHEKLAKSFEAYLREGNSPTAELQPVFTEIKGWMIRVYKQLSQLLGVGEQLSDDIRGVFDRMVATDAQITASEDFMGYVALYSNAEEMGVTQRTFEVYRALMAESHDEAVDHETKKMLKAMLWGQQQWWKDELKKITAEVRDEAVKKLVYKAMAFLQKGELPDESTFPGTPFKLDKADLIRRYGKDFIKRLPRPWVYAVEGGVDTDLAAKALGYNSGNELIQALVAAPPMEAYIRDESRRRMQELHPDPLSSPDMADEATRAVHNEKRGRVLAAEMRALRKQMKADRKIVSATKKDIKEQEKQAIEANKAQLPDRIELAHIKEAAKKVIGAMRIRDVNPNYYLQQERKAGRLAFEAMKRKDHQEAYAQKLKQIQHYEAYRAAVRHKAQSARDQRYLKRFAPSGKKQNALRRRMGKAGVLDQIDAIIEGINFRKISGARIDRENLNAEMLKAVNQGIADGTLVVPPDVLKTLETPGGINWQEMTFEEFAGVRDVIKQLEHQGRTQLEIIINGEKVVIQDAVDAVTESIMASNKVIAIPRGERKAGAKAKKNIREGIGHWLRASSIARILDGAGFGAVTRKIIVPIRRAYTEKLYPRIQQMSEDVAQIYKAHYTNEEMGKLSEKIEDSGDEKMSKADILALGLNWGSETNRAAVLGGIMEDALGNKSPAYTEQDVAQLLSRLDARDWAFIQEMWDYQNSYWSELSETEQRRRGIAPEKVEALAFEITTSDGQTITVRGGYHPLQYNAEHGGQVSEKEFEDYFNRVTNGTYVSANTRAGATYNRVKGHGKVVLLSLNTIDRNLREVIRDITIGDEINLVRRILTSKEVGNVARNTGNNDLIKELQLWLSDAAVGELPAQSAWEKGLSWVRVGFTKSKLAFNLYVTMLQLTGIAQSMAVIGSKNYGIGVGKFITNPAGNYKMVMERSKFMNARYGILQTWDKDVQDTNNFLSSFFGPAPTKFKGAMDTVGHYYFWPIAKFQSVVDVTTWMGAYEKGLNEMALDDESAVLYADTQVEASQTSGLFSDRSGLERGTLGSRTRQSQFVRLWTTLVSYMLAKGNIAYEKGVGFKRKPTLMGAVHLATDYALLFLIEGMAASLLYGMGPGEEDEDETFGGWMAKVTLDSMLSGIPLVREYSAAKYGSGNTPVGALVFDSYKFIQQVKQGEADEAAVKSGVKVVGTLFHLPASQVNRAVEAAMSDDDSELYEYFTGKRDK